MHTMVEVNQHHHPNHFKGLNHHGSPKDHLVKVSSTKKEIFFNTTSRQQETFYLQEDCSIFQKIGNSDKRPKNIRMGIWLKNRLSGVTISRKSSTPGSSVNARVRINQVRGRGNVEKGGHSPSSLKGQSFSKHLVSSSKKGWGNQSEDIKIIHLLFSLQNGRFC